MTDVLILHNYWTMDQPSQFYLRKIEQLIIESGGSCRVLGPTNFLRHGCPMSVSILLKNLLLSSKERVLWFVDNGSTDLRSFFHHFKGPKVYDYSPSPWILSPYARELAQGADCIITHTKTCSSQLAVGSNVSPRIIPQSSGLDLLPIGIKDKQSAFPTAVIFGSADANAIDFALSRIRRISLALLPRVIIASPNEDVVSYVETLRDFWRLGERLRIIRLSRNDSQYLANRRTLFECCDFMISAADDWNYDEFLQSQLYEMPSLIPVNGTCSGFATGSTLQFDSADPLDFVQTLVRLIDAFEEYNKLARENRALLISHLSSWDSELKELVGQLTFDRRTP